MLVTGHQASHLGTQGGPSRNGFTSGFLNRVSQVRFLPGARSLCRVSWHAAGKIPNLDLRHLVRLLLLTAHVRSRKWFYAPPTDSSGAHSKISCNQISSG